MSDEVDLVICSGFSPGARVLRAAVREAGKTEKIRMVTVAPALAGLPKAIEDIKGLKDRCVVVVDGCEGFCGLQTLMQFGIEPAAKLMLNKHVQVTDAAVKMETDKIVKLVKEARTKCEKV
jgi:uncharacterized metal-binding protein